MESLRKKANTHVDRKFSTEYNMASSVYKSEAINHTPQQSKYSTTHGKYGHHNNNQGYNNHHSGYYRQNQWKKYQYAQQSHVNMQAPVAHPVWSAKWDGYQWLYMVSDGSSMLNNMQCTHTYTPHHPLHGFDIQRRRDSAWT